MGYEKAASYRGKFDLMISNTGTRLISACLFLCAIFTSCRQHRELAKNNTGNPEKKIKSKYAQLMGVGENSINNIKLYAFIDKWYGTPYRYSGKTTGGIDCSDFVSVLQAQVFNRAIGPPARSMYDKCKPLTVKNLEEGDLVFFKIESDNISHVGVYLQNGHFVHASKSKGVVISSLDENYYKKYFFKGGRIK